MSGPMKMRATLGAGFTDVRVLMTHPMAKSADFPKTLEDVFFGRKEMSLRHRNSNYGTRSIQSDPDTRYRAM